MFSTTSYCINKPERIIFDKKNDTEDFTGNTFLENISISQAFGLPFYCISCATFEDHSKKYYDSHSLQAHKIDCKNQNAPFVCPKSMKKIVEVNYYVINCLNFCNSSIEFADDFSATLYLDEINPEWLDGSGINGENVFLDACNFHILLSNNSEEKRKVKLCQEMVFCEQYMLYQELLLIRNFHELQNNLTKIDKYTQKAKDKFKDRSFKDRTSQDLEWAESEINHKVIDLHKWKFSYHFCDFASKEFIDDKKILAKNIDSLETSEALNLLSKMKHEPHYPHLSSYQTIKKALKEFGTKIYRNPAKYTNLEGFYCEENKRLKEKASIFLLANYEPSQKYRASKLANVPNDVLRVIAKIYAELTYLPYLGHSILSESKQI